MAGNYDPLPEDESDMGNLNRENARRNTEPVLATEITDFNYHYIETQQSEPDGSHTEGTM